MKKLVYIALLLVVITTIACQKTDSSSANTNTANNSCSALGTIQDTVINNGVKYYIVASSGASNVIGIELVNKNGLYASNLSVSFLQAINGSNCFQSSNVTAYTGSQYKAYGFGSFPAWAIDTTTICIAKITIGSTNFYLRDSKLNK